MEFSVLKDSIIALAAFIGAGIGLYNFLSVREKGKLKLEVIPKAVLTNGRTPDGKEVHITTPHRISIERASMSEYVAVEIINRSDFDVTISIVGFGFSGTTERLTIAEPILPDKGEWPRKLGPRESVTVYGLLRSFQGSKFIEKVDHAFAETACNNVVTGKSVALNQMVRSKSAE